MAGVLLNGARVDLSLDLSHLGLELDESSVVVVVSLNLRLQSPVAVLMYLVDDVGVGSGVGGDSLEEPGRYDVGGGFAGNGWLSVKLVEMDAVVGPAESPLDETRPWQAANVAGLEVDPVDLDEKVGDTARVLLEPVGTLLLDVVTVVVPFELGESGAHSLKGSIGGGEGDLLGGESLLVVARHAVEPELGVVGFVESHLGDLLRQTESHFRG